ncbi:MAG: hypothetical protein ACTSXP_09915 [Promethearchaeota archaeon]
MENDDDTRFNPRKIPGTDKPEWKAKPMSTDEKPATRKADSSRGKATRVPPRLEKSAE